jgi:hypothetical protein
MAVSLSLYSSTSYPEAMHMGISDARDFLESKAFDTWVAAQLGHSLDVFYRDYAKWISHQDDDREMIKIEAQINENIPELSLRFSRPA